VVIRVAKRGDGMPPDGHNDLDTRYQRYFSTIGTQVGQRPAPGGSRRRRRLTVVGVAAALLVGVFSGMAIQSARDRSSATLVTRTVPESEECQQAFEQAERSLDEAVRVEQALAEHTEYMNQLMEGEIDASTARQKGMPSLVNGASASVRFDAALNDYRRALRSCQLTTGTEP
jgi:predicted Zn-dependent protease